MEDLDPSRVEALLFDLGGVVVEIDFERAIRSWAAGAGCEPDDLRGRFSMDPPYEEHERGRIDWHGYLSSLRGALGVELDDDALLRGWNDIFLDPVAGMGPLLQAASERFPLYLFSNSNPTHQAVWAARYAEQLRPFRELFVSSELGLRKPSTEAFHEVARRIGVEPSAILFFDDTESNVLGARAAGLQAVHFRSETDARDALATLAVRV